MINHRVITLTYLNNKEIKYEQNIFIINTSFIRPELDKILAQKVLLVEH